VQLYYAYDLPVPSPFAAFIQIIHTCRALSEQGVEVTVVTGPLEAASVEDALRWYGLSPHERLEIRPALDGTRHGWGRLRAALRSGERHDRRILMSRGESGIELFRRFGRSDRRPADRWVYEAHRLSYEHALDRGPTGSTVAHRLLHRAYVRRLRSREARTVQQADALVCLTGGVRQALADEFAPTAPSLVLPSGTRLPTEPPPDDDERDLDVVYVGKLTERKGVYDLVGAMRYLPTHRLCLVGGQEDEMRAVRQWAERLGVERQVDLVGYVEPSDVGAYLRRARVGVCPLPSGVSRIAEVFTSPLKLLDMMAHGTPIVATDLPSVRELVTHGATALLAPPSDPEPLARSIGELLSDRGRARRLAQAARQEVEEYTWDRRAERLRTFLETLP
jgi:glycosyltransferase involved in cell wall biosynthesis